MWRRVVRARIMTEAGERVLKKQSERFWVDPRSALLVLNCNADSPHAPNRITNIHDKRQPRSGTLERLPLSFAFIHTVP